MDIVTLFCDIDDFCQEFEPEMNRHLIADGKKKRRRKSTLGLSEVMTIVVAFHQSGYRTFKDYYIKHVSLYLRWAFPRLVSYNRFRAAAGYRFGNRPTACGTDARCPGTVVCVSIHPEREM